MACSHNKPRLGPFSIIAEDRHISAMAKPPDRPRAPEKPKRDPAKHSKKDPAKPTRAKASRPELAADRAGARRAAQSGHRPGNRGTGFADRACKPPADNSFDRRADFAAAHRARKSTPQELREPPQAGYAGKGAAPLRRSMPNWRRRSASTREEPDGDSAADRKGIANFRGITGASATVSALEQLLREGRPEFSERPWTPHRPPRPEKSEGGQRLVIKSDFDAEGRPAAGDRRPGGGHPAPRSHAGAARRHRLRQDLHDGQGDRGNPAAGAGARAQQDAGGPALRRVQSVLSRQRGRVFRQLLRLLPARGLRPAHRHLYREGIVDQRADRSHAAQRDARAARARRRHHRGVGIVHLRHRLGRDLFGHDLHARAAASASTSAS